MLDISTLRKVMRGPLLGLPSLPSVAWENQRFTPPAGVAAGQTVQANNSSMFIEEGVEVLDEVRQATRLILTLGETRYEVFAPLAAGTEGVDAFAKQIADAYEPGLNITGSGIAVNLFKTRRLPGGRRDPESDAGQSAWYSVPVIISWRVFTPTIQT